MPPLRLRPSAFPNGCATTRTANTRIPLPPRPRGRLMKKSPPMAKTTTAKPTQATTATPPTPAMPRTPTMRLHASESLPSATTTPQSCEICWRKFGGYRFLSLFSSFMILRRFQASTVDESNLPAWLPIANVVGTKRRRRRRCLCWMTMALVGGVGTGTVVVPRWSAAWRRGKGKTCSYTKRIK